MSYYKNTHGMCVCMYDTVFRKFHLPSSHEPSYSQQTPRPIGKAILHPLGTHPHTARANW